MTGLAHNPALHAGEELVGRFVARTQLFGRVVEDLHARQPQHQLFIGQRGMGKTTLLHRIAAEIGRDPGSQLGGIGLTFPEEQYNVSCLSDLWLNCLDALADALEHEGDTTQVQDLDRFVRGLPNEEAVRAPLALERLLSWTRAHRGMVLCIDNLQQLLGRLDAHERWALRKVLGEEQRLVVFAASPAPPSETTEYGEAFYDFFQAHALRGLSLDETREVLRNLAIQAGKPDLAASFSEKGGRLRALHVLTGGNPRTVVQLFQVASASPGAEIRAQLEALLDQCTPLYKARFEELAEQAQLVLDALAHQWDPATAAMVAARTRMEVNSVSTQLHRLHNEGLVDKVDLPGEARQGFQVSERFFNLWYLMRASRRHRGRVMSLARCLETLYDIDDLQALGAQLLGAPGDADLRMALARALPEGGMRRALWSSAIDQVGGERGFRALLAQFGAGVEPVRKLAERKKVAKEAMAIVRVIDFEGMGVERELGEVQALWVAMTGASLGELAAYPPFLDLVRESTWNAARLRMLYGPVVWECLRAGVSTGQLSSLALEQCDALDIEAAAIRGNCSQLRLKHHLESGGLAGPGGCMQDIAAEGDAAVWRLMALFTAVPPGGFSAEATRAAWEEISRSNNVVCARVEVPPNPEQLALARTSCLRACHLGTNDPVVLSLALVALDDIEEPTRRLLQLADPAAAWHSQRMLVCIAARHPTAALRIYHHFARIRDPLLDTPSLLSFLAALIRAGHIDDALQIAVGLRDRAEPLHAALVAVHGRDVALLGRFAPEIAIPARDTLLVLWPEGLAERPSPRASKKKRR